MNTTNIQKAREAKTIAVRLTDTQLQKRLEKLAKEQNLSFNMTINMLLGYAFNEIDRSKKTFQSKIVFESK